MDRIPTIFSLSVFITLLFILNPGEAKVEPQGIDTQEIDNLISTPVPTVARWA